MRVSGADALVVVGERRMPRPSFSLSPVSLPLDNQMYLDLMLLGAYVFALSAVSSWPLYGFCISTPSDHVPFRTIMDVDVVAPKTLSKSNTGLPLHILYQCAPLPACYAYYTMAEMAG